MNLSYIEIKEAKVENRLKIPDGKFRSDWFKCGKCGYTVRLLTLGNTATCSQCGGRMERC